MQGMEKSIALYIVIADHVDVMHFAQMVNLETSLVSGDVIESGDVSGKWWRQR
jgi:hypothetical protein